MDHPTTSTGSFELVNYTHYNTTDLLAVLEKVESFVPAGARVTPNGKPKMAQNVTMAAVTGETSRVVFKSFTGVPRHAVTYTNGGRQTGNRLILARQRWKTPTELRMLPPDKLHANPLEAIAVAGEGLQPTVPPYMVVEIAERFISFYEAWGYRSGLSKDVVLNAVRSMQIRYSSKRAATAPKRSRAVVAAERLSAAVTDSSWRNKAAQDKIETLNLVGSRIAKNAQVLGLDNNIPALARALEAARVALYEEMCRVAKEATERAEA